MTTITYTYDETKMTNRDYMIAVLTDSIDDGGASYESLAKYDIACPYNSEDDCLNSHEINGYGTNEYSKGCTRCKLLWLKREYDTYPSDDESWED